VQDSATQTPAKALAQTDLQLKHLPQDYRDDVQKMIERQFEYSKKDKQLEAATRTSWQWGTLIVFLLSGFLVAVVLADEVNLINLPRVGDDPPEVAAIRDAQNDAAPAGIGELLGAFLPLFTIAIAFFVGATGLTRLQLYDEQFAQNRRERREDIGDLRRQLSEETESLKDALSTDLTDLYQAQKEQSETATREIGALRAKIEQAQKEADQKFDRRSDEIERRLGVQLDEGRRAAVAAAQAEARKLATESSEEVVDGKIRDIDDAKASLASRLDEIERKIDARIERIRPILENPNIEKVFSEGRVASIGQLHSDLRNLLSGVDGQERDVAAAEALVTTALEDGITGTANDFFNAATQLAQADLEPIAYKIAKAGLEQYPSNPDLMSNTLKFASDSGLVEEARELYQRVLDKPVEFRNWRIWIFVSDYLSDRGELGDAGTWAMSYLRRYFDADWNPLPETQLPADRFNERLAANYVTQLNSYARYTEAELVCRAVLQAYPTSPQTSLAFATLLREIGNYEEAAEWAANALAADVKDQSNIGNATAFEIRATSSVQEVFRAAREHDATAARDASQDLFKFCAAMLSMPDAAPNHFQWIRYNANKVIVALLEVGVPHSSIVPLVPQAIRPLLPALEGDAQTGGDGDPIATLSLQVLAALNAIAERPRELRDQAIGELAEQINRAVPDETLGRAIAAIEAEVVKNGSQEARELCARLVAEIRDL
jgi:tetratricopeptide (TPR) repeat protein